MREKCFLNVLLIAYMGAKYENICVYIVDTEISTIMIDMCVIKMFTSNNL